ncbi:MAG: hypothetical protein DMD77_27455 [Candidatus Rokuibacteriota bacterium]|nr:MAG: hypothetical protein DMD77_27455 [Candidatus Rokubacteria bacterium]
MRRASLLIVVIVMLVGLVAFLGSQVPPVGAARPYEGQTIRAVVNAEYVKYSLSLVEKDLYDKLGVKIETEVIPLDAFVSKTLLEFNSGSSPWDLVMFGPSNMPDYGRHFEPLEPWMQKLKLDFAVEDIVPVFAKVMLRYQGKLVSMPYDGDIHMMYWNKVAFERGRGGGVLQRLGLGRLGPQALRGGRLLQAIGQRVLVPLVAIALLLVRRAVF